MLAGCHARTDNSGVDIEFTLVPLADQGGPDKIDVIEGRATGARPRQQIILFARSGMWYIQPFADQPFTTVQPDSTWRSTTHLGTEYAALLVEPGYHPPSTTATLPPVGGGVIAIATTKGTPVFWQRWWFVVLFVLAGMSALLAFYSYRLRRLTRHLNMRFEERLAERTRIAQELHDTLLQGVISASMQLHVAVDRLPEDLPAKPSLTHVLQVMGQILDEGRNALHRLRSSANSDPLDVEQALAQVRQELALQEQSDFRITVEGRPRPLHPLIRDEVYRIGREALINALRHSHASRVEVEIEYRFRRLRVVVRDDGCGIDPQVLRSEAETSRGIAAMRRRAEGIGARLKIRSRPAAGTEVELSVPGHVAFSDRPSKSPLRWFARGYRLSAGTGPAESRKGGMKYE